MTRWILPLLLAATSALACSTETRPVRVTLSPEVAEYAIQALDLWTEATDGQFAAEVTVSDDCAGAELCITQVDAMAVNFCLESDHIAPRACNWQDPDGLHRIVLNAAGTRPEERVSTFAHEVGHRVGLSHKPGTDDLMDPERTHEVRVAPCVSVEDVSLAGFNGPGACLPVSAL